MPAIGHMQTAYTDAVGRTVSSAAHLNVLAGLISGSTFTPGVYEWSTGVSINSDIYVKGSRDDIFIFKTLGNLAVGTGVRVVLEADNTGLGFPLSSNIFWVVIGDAGVDVGSTSHLEGIILSKTSARREIRPPSRPI